MAPSGKSTAGTKRRRSPAKSEMQSYIAQIDDHGLDYLLAVGDEPKPARPYREYATLLLNLRFIAPSSIAGRQIEAHLLGNRDIDKSLDADKDGEFIPRCVGTLTLRANKSGYLGSLPMSVLWNLIPAITSKKVMYVVFHGTPLYRGEAVIQSIYFRSKVDLDEWLTE
ncbi:hypothetical protein FBZ92_113125 [Nitrospirillum viridazoti]|uniref:Uncharacterized protein n=2 Tax=Nitrospirillum TaxID=1543705 RepID=A0A560IDG2_9PROT|nr:hypothetical protein FBZ92_113125 [Nitrospirillum amazonense]